MLDGGFDYLAKPKHLKCTNFERFIPFSSCPINTLSQHIVNSKLYFDVTKRKQKASVKVSAASAVSPIYILPHVSELPTKRRLEPYASQLLQRCFFFTLPNQALRWSLVIYIFPTTQIVHYIFFTACLSNREINVFDYYLFVIFVNSDPDFLFMKIWSWEFYKDSLTVFISKSYVTCMNHYGFKIFRIWSIKHLRMILWTGE